MRRVLVIGPGGAGKSTFAWALAARSGLPLVQLDALYWRAGWVPASDDEWDRIIERVIARDAWVMDGNYGRTLPRRLAVCDTVFFLDLPPLVCLWRVFRRWLRYRGRSRPEMPPGCPEGLTWDFVAWIWTYRKRRRPAVVRQLAALPPGKRAVVFRSAGDVRAYLDALP